jgi:excisionase family DNA binding protein
MSSVSGSRRRLPKPDRGSRALGTKDGRTVDQYAGAGEQLLLGEASVVPTFSGWSLKTRRAAPPLDARSGVSGDGGAASDATSATDGSRNADDAAQRGIDRQAAPNRLSWVEAPLLLTVPQVEAALQLGRTRTYELLRSGEIPVLRVGRMIRVPRAALEVWVAQSSSTASG